MNKNNKIHETLLHIKNNPCCSTSSENIDGKTVKQLYEIDYVSGVDCTTIHEDTPNFIELEITANGELYLDNIKSSKGKSNFITPLAVTVIGGLIVSVIVIFLLQPWQEKNQAHTPTKEIQRTKPQSSK